MSDLYNIREIDIDALLSITTGTLLCSNFRKMHEAAEYVIGHPIMTHHFANDRIVDNIRSAVLWQHPDLLLCNTDHVNPSNWKEQLKELESMYGKTRVVQKGDYCTMVNMYEGVPEHAHAIAIEI